MSESVIERVRAGCLHRTGPTGHHNTQPLLLRIETSAVIRLSPRGAEWFAGLVMHEHRDRRLATLHCTRGCQVRSIHMAVVTRCSSLALRSPLWLIMHFSQLLLTARCVMELQTRVSRKLHFDRRYCRTMHGPRACVLVTFERSRHHPSSCHEQLLGQSHRRQPDDVSDCLSS